MANRGISANLPPMRGVAPGDVIKVWLYAAACVWLGAWLSPLVFNAGKALAEVSATKETNGPLRWLADQCRTMSFGGFFKLSLGLCGMALFLPFAEWLRGAKMAQGFKVGSLRLPEGARYRTSGQRLEKNPRGPRQAATGFAGVALLFFLIATVLVLAGVFEWRSATEPLLKGMLKALAMSLCLAVAQEVLFRGIAMGVFLRAMRPAAALGMSAVLFALVHFLNPPAGLNVLDPEAAGAGFEMLRKIAAQFSDPRMMIGTFTPLLALGGILAYARWETASLWLPIGLHAGWIFVNAILAKITLPVSHPDSLMWVLSGANLQQGLLPLAGILVAGGLAIRLTTPADVQEPTA